MLSSKHRHMSSRYDSKLFPLSDDFFPEIHLTHEQIQRYETQVQHLVDNVLSEYERHDAKGGYPIYNTAPWVPVGTHGALTAIRKQTSPQLTHNEFRLYGHIPCNYQTLMNFHYAETSDEHFECSQFMYGYAVDAMVLKNIHTKSSGKKHEYLGIKWLCLQPSHFGRKRDTCFLEYLTYTKDKLDRPVGVRVTMPLEIEECPDLFRRLRTKRITPRSVAIVRPVGSSDVTELFLMSENDFAGLSPRTKNFKKLMSIYNNMSVIIDSKHILKHGIMNKTNWVPNDLRKACTNCQLPFNAAKRRRYHCRLCGDIFCYQCVIDRKVPRDARPLTTSRVFQVTKTHFCTACLSTLGLGKETSQTYPPRLVRDRSIPLNTAEEVEYEKKKGRKKLREVVSDDDQSNSRMGWWDEMSLDWSESDWSETDSECASKVSLNASLSSSCPSWGDKNVENTPFVATLDVINDDGATTIPDVKDRNRRSRLHKTFSMSGCYPTRRRPSAKQLRKQIETQEVSDVIETTEKMTLSELSQESRTETTGVEPPTPANRKDTGYESLHDSRGSTNRWNHEEAPTKIPSRRSISQCLAEQEELLRCMLSMSRGYAKSGADTSSKPVTMNFAATMPAPRSTVRVYEM
ncbi:hypothetical protein PsorP6_016122 [Peronosclerospora sorghi]|uniref:Uncharacterized protein n=1 Tax=Peronosclerospora sorghi TaxID=230839 RepID=A0ACC0VSK6_9STRA|nr:hypothetical protein PsorP6_016122 [Peronosclerospora sorghi]